LGNVNIEILNYGKLLRTLRLVPKKDGVIGVAFEPNSSIQETLKVLDEIGISHRLISYL